MKTDLLEDASAWAQLNDVIEVLKTAQERHACALEAAADKRCKSSKAYKRSGQYPELIGYSSHGDKCTFLVNNGYDDKDDFLIEFTITELMHVKEK
jgi:hypothetical protein